MECLPSSFIIIVGEPITVSTDMFVLDIGYISEANMVSQKWGLHQLFLCSSYEPQKISERTMSQPNEMHNAVRVNCKVCARIQYSVSSERGQPKSFPSTGRKVMLILFSHSQDGGQTFFARTSLERHLIVLNQNIQKTFNTRYLELNDKSAFKKILEWGLKKEFISLTWQFHTLPLYWIKFLLHFHNHRVS